MKGIYKIPIGDISLDLAEQHPKVQALLRACDEGAHVNIAIRERPLVLSQNNYNGWSTPVVETRSVERYLEIRATGGKPRRKRPAKPVVVPPPLSAEQIARRAAQASKDLQACLRAFRAQLEAQSRPRWWSYGRYRHISAETIAGRARRKAIGDAIACIIARHRGNRSARLTQDDYALLDTSCGRRVRRASQLTRGYTNVLEYVIKFEAHGYGFRFGKPAQVADTPVESHITAFTRLKAEVEYFNELLRLAKGAEK